MRLGRQLQEGRHGEGLAGPAGDHPGGEKAQESHVLRFRRKQPGPVADSCVGQSLEGEDRRQPGRLCHVPREVTVVRTMVFQRQEGNGAGDGAQLHRRGKALKGQTP